MTKTTKPRSDAMRVDRAEYNRVRAERKAKRLAAKAAKVAARKQENEAKDRATLKEVVALIDKRGGPVYSTELKKLGHRYLRVAKVEVERPDSPLMCLDGAFSRFNTASLSLTGAGT